MGGLEKHAESVESVLFLNNLPYAASASIDGNIHVWDMSSNSKRFSTTYSEAVTKLMQTSDGSRLICSYFDGLIKVFDSKTGDLIQELHGHDKSVLDFDIRKDGAILVSSSDDGACLVFSVSWVRTWQNQQWDGTKLEIKLIKREEDILSHIKPQSTKQKRKKR